MAEKKSPLENVIQMALDAGATHVEVAHAGGTSVDVHLLEGEMDKFEYAASDALGLRVVIGKKQATTRTSNLEESSVKNLVGQTIAMANAAPEDPYLCIAPKSDLITKEQIETHLKNLDLVDASSSPSPEELREAAKICEDAGKSVKGVEKSVGSWASFSKSEKHIIFSSGFEGRSASTMHSVGAGMIAGSGENMVREYEYSAKHHLADLESAASLGKKAGEKAVKLLGGKSINLGKVPVIFHKDVSGGLLGDFASAINGSAISKGTSFLKEEMGNQLFGKNITITDDPFMARGYGSRAFDGEGLTPEKRNIIENGVLQSWILDLSTAKKLGLKSTGNASRSLASLPHPSVSNFYMENGKDSLENLMADIKKGFLIMDTMGYGANTITGDFSQGASGFLIENGKITKPLHDMTIAGNLKEMFLNLTPADDLEFKSSINAPSFRIEGITVGGKG